MFSKRIILTFLVFLFVLVYFRSEKVNENFQSGYLLHSDFAPTQYDSNMRNYLKCGIEHGFAHALCTEQARELTPSGLSLIGHITYNNNTPNQTHLLFAQYDMVRQVTNYYYMKNGELHLLKSGVLHNGETIYNNQYNAIIKVYFNSDVVSV
jgi:hypothetical protein